MTYTKRIDGIEIRNVICIGRVSPHDRFDIVKWQEHEPILVTDAYTGQMKYITKSCYSIATLEWNPHEEEFELVSVGMRLAEEAPSKEVFNMILEFAKQMREEFINENA